MNNLSLGSKLGVCALALAALGVGSAGLADDRSLMKRLKADGEVPVSAFAEAAEARAAELDANGDGVVTQEEMKAHREKQRAKMEEKRFPDANDDGVVSETEFVDAARARFARLDANEDGVLSKDEMPERPRRRRGRGGER